jgi:biofilm PGA synthesis N-glycosyltransferase PgaC
LNIFTLFYYLFDYGILVYALVISLSYLALAWLSAKEITRHLKRNRFVSPRSILSSPLAPSISILAPAYNEAITIVENVKSLLSLHYNNYEVIILNDGSKDDTISKLTEYFKLVEVDFAYNEVIKTKPVRAVYKSTEPAFAHLLVVDKVNGGKADAINVGINVSQNRLFACIDVDCILESDALLRMVKPFLEERTKKIIAVGGVVRIANSCKVEHGKITQVVLPEKFLARVQVLEYFRAFLLGRMAWSRLDGLMLISGAFGLFDKEIAVKAGGYNHQTVGEDMELVVRMRRYMIETQKKAHSVVFIPEPLCWTEAPDSAKILSRQRNRWTRGTIETLYLHRRLLFNRKYKLLGMLSFPYWLFFEWMAPLIEVSGTIYFILIALFGKPNWPFFFSLLGLVYSFSLLFSLLAITTEEKSYFQYRKKGDLRKLLLTALLEPILFHPRTTLWAIKGNYDLYKGKKSWGEMTRTGFTNKP